MAKIRKLLDDLTGQTEAREQAKKEAALLVEQAMMKLDILENKLKDLFRNRELESQVQIVGDRMGAFAREYRVNYEDGNISEAVSSLVNQIMDIGSEKAQKIISKAITNALNSMFTNVMISEEEKRLFVIVLEGVALVRYDIYVWRKSESDRGLFKHAESVVAITYARSIVDHTKVSEDELNDAIYRSLGTVSVNEVIEYKKSLIELFKLQATNVMSLSFAKQQRNFDTNNILVAESKSNKDNLIYAMKLTHTLSEAELENKLENKKSKDAIFAEGLCNK